ncbi:MAG: hypothetical protein GY862_22935 [Gammaproteobacteria bacterium]|nr:hypothetical protein [Gammaproteobacteria bacterium]
MDLSATTVSQLAPAAKAVPAAAPSEAPAERAEAEAVPEDAEDEQAARMKRSEIRDTNPGFRKLHPGYSLTHHPSAWLNQEAENCLEKMYFEGNFAAHLCGHTDEADYVRLSQKGGYAKNTLRGHSLFGLEFFGRNKCKRPYGYSVGKIELYKEAGQLLFWPRESNHDKQPGRIIPDESFVLDENNQHTMPRQLGRTGPKK